MKEERKKKIYFITIAQNEISVYKLECLKKCIHQKNLKLICNKKKSLNYYLLPNIRKSAFVKKEKKCLNMYYLKLRV